MGWDWGVGGREVRERVEEEVDEYLMPEDEKVQDVCIMSYDLFHPSPCPFTFLFIFLYFPFILYSQIKTRWSTTDS